VRYDTLKVAKRLEAELGEEQASFIEGEPSDWELLPPPEGCFKVGIDGGYVRNWVDKKHKFEVIVGKSIRRCDESAAEVEAPSLKRFGFVQTLDTKSKRRLYEVLHAQNIQMNQDITFLSDGNDSLRQLQFEMSPKATHILDWYHLSMGLDHGIGHFMLFEVDSKAQAPVPLRPKSPPTSSAASDRKSAPLLSCRQAG